MTQHKSGTLEAFIYALTNANMYSTLFVCVEHTVQYMYSYII